eukprot:2492271-Pleurochrysis_carterae.AAC.2
MASAVVTAVIMHTKQHSAPSQHYQHRSDRAQQPHSAPSYRHLHSGRLECRCGAFGWLGVAATSGEPAFRGDFVQDTRLSDFALCPERTRSVDEADLPMRRFKELDGKIREKTVVDQVFRSCRKVPVGGVKANAMQSFPRLRRKRSKKCQLERGRKQRNLHMHDTSRSTCSRS